MDKAVKDIQGMEIFSPDELSSNEDMMKALVCKALEDHFQADFDENEQLLNGELSGTLDNGFWAFRVYETVNQVSSASFGITQCFGEYNAIFIRGEKNIIVEINRIDEKLSYTQTMDHISEYVGLAVHKGMSQDDLDYMVEDLMKDGLEHNILLEREAVFNGVFDKFNGLIKFS